MFKNNEKNWRKKPRIREHTQTPKKKRRKNQSKPQKIKGRRVRCMRDRYPRSGNQKILGRRLRGPMRRNMLEKNLKKKWKEMGRQNKKATELPPPPLSSDGVGTIENRK